MPVLHRDQCRLDWLREERVLAKCLRQVELGLTQRESDNIPHRRLRGGYRGMIQRFRSRVLL